MMQVNDIVVPTDFSECSLRALDLAISMVSPEGEIYLLNVVDTRFLDRFEDNALGTREQATEKMRAVADRKLDSVIADRQDAAKKINKMIVVGIPFVEILKIAKDLDFGLIVMGIRGGGTLIEELFFGSTADKVLRGARVPVLCAP